MKVIWIALREYLENTTTKGFWIGILLLPIIIYISIEAQNWLNKAVPTRNCVVVDRSGLFEEKIDEAFKNLHARRVVKAFGEWVQKNAKEGLVSGGESGKSLAEQLEETPAGGAAKALEEIQELNPAIVRKFVDGGLDLLLEGVKPLLIDEPSEFEEPKPEFRRVALPQDVPPEASLEELQESLRPYLRGQREIEVEGESAELFAAIFIPPDIEKQILRPGIPNPEQFSGRGVEYWSSNLADDELYDEFRSIFNREVRRREYETLAIDTKVIDRVEKMKLRFSKLNPKKEEGKEEVSVADIIRQWAPVAFVYLLWIGIFMILRMLLNNTIEEKSNRLIEVLLSSVTPGELMIGKLLGIAMVGLTMISAWIGSVVLILWLRSGPETEFVSSLLEILSSSGLLYWFALYFVLGYLLYSGLFLAIGSVCNTIKEAQNLMGPIMLIMIVPLLTMMFIPRDPNGTLATVLSWIPLYTPFVMMNRAAADPPTFDVIGTLVLLILTTILTLWLSGKIFRVGILRTGQPPKLLELLRWTRGGGQ